MSLRKETYSEWRPNFKTAILNKNNKIFEAVEEKSS
jgi:hypothetical protein